MKQQVSHMRIQDIHHLVPGPLTQQCFPKIAPVRSSTVPVKLGELPPRGQSKKLLACTSLVPCQGMPWHGLHMSCCQQTAQPQSKPLIPMIMLLKFGCLFLGLYSCRNKAVSLSLLREQFVLIDATTVRATGFMYRKKEASHTGTYRPMSTNAPRLLN